MVMLTDDPTEIQITPRPELEVTKTASVTSRDEFIGAGDVITYTRFQLEILGT